DADTNTGDRRISIIDDTGLGSGIVTTDLTGEFGFNVSDNTGFPLGDRDFLEDIDYTSRFNGTSASAPIVSGVIALMLQANPNLTWRDVQEILVRSSRQNSEFATQADGLDKTTGAFYQSSWIINQVPLFHDPDEFDPLIDPGLLLLNPTLDPSLSRTISNGKDAHYAPTPQVLTNGAGYTVSQGRGTNFDQTGFAHGVVDAELAVLLAQQWHTKGQDLPDELTFTTSLGIGSRFNNLPAAELVENLFGAGSLDLVVPGGLDGQSDYIDYWDEYLEDEPDFTQPFNNRRGLPIELTVPSPNDMTIETIEISFQIGGSITEFLDHVRVVLVSPSGTHSELTPYFVDPSFIGNDNFHQSVVVTANGLNGFVQPRTDYRDAGSVDSGIGGIIPFTFSTNRNWGERSDDAIIFDPTTAEPVIDTSLFFNGGNRFNFINSFVNDSLIPSDLLTQGWQLYMENYSDADLSITNFEFAWHGSPIDPGTERVQGLIGIDDNRNDQFNYSRVIPLPVDLNSTVRLGDVLNIIDPNHESMAANITVFAHRDSGDIEGILDAGDVLVDQFVTGADGNYFFDLVPDDYILSLDPASLGSLTALDDSLKPAGFLQDYQSQWAITTDFFKVWDYDANLEVPINPVTNAPGAFLDGFGSAVTYGMKHINFLLDPGTPPAPQVDFSGFVFADINGDGLFNGDDVAVPGVGVFGDVNRNGALDAGEILVTTNADGEYLLTVPVTTTTVMNVGVRPPVNWTASNPDTEFLPFFVQPGDTFADGDADFHIQPPSGSTSGEGLVLSGILLGAVFNDKNENGTRQTDELGVQGITVYIDMNNSGAFDAGDIDTKTNDNGAYAFANVPDGSHFLGIEFDPNSLLSQTIPIFNLPQVAAIISGGTVTGIDFGISSSGVFDFGDLPAVYGTLLADDGARHPVGIFFLGATEPDAEADGFPTSDALGDDLNFLADEDGVVLVGGELVPGSTGTLMVTASRHGGYFQAWFDFNGVGGFEENVEGVVSEKVVVNRLLIPGVNVVTFAIPETIAGSTVYARFRYGEFDLGPTGPALVGEVEDYRFGVYTSESGLVLVHGPDFNEDGEINGFDFLAWQRGFGMTVNATAGDGDSNSDGAVDNADLADWEAEYGTGSSSAAATATVTATVQTGDLDQDGQVADTDLTTWEASYGTDNSGTNAPVAVAARAAVSSPSTLTTSNLSESIDFSPASSEAVVDSTPTSAERPDSNTLAFVASEVQRRFRHTHRFNRHDDNFHWRARIETQITETSFGDSIDLIDLGSVLRDRAVDRLFGWRDRLFDQLPFHRDHEGHETEDALETVLGEEIEWRFA
ncbi:MAG: S8 family serine peptidase, partial [Planctomycetes bacterium]|nr:S8 family serine peptidase [Planctomycetota bacterium]